MVKRIRRFFTSKEDGSIDTVKSFADTQKAEEAFNEKRDLGLRPVPLFKIIGSVGRYRDFDRRFRLKRDKPSDRLERVKKAFFQPLTTIIKNSSLHKAFPERTAADLYAYISYNQWEKGRRRKYGIGIDQLIPKDMALFRAKMETMKTSELPQMQHWISAFILISVKVGREYRVMEKLFKMDAVQEVHFVHGEFDLIVKIVIKRDLLASDSEIIGQFVHEKVRRVPEVAKTQTLIPISSMNK